MIQLLMALALAGGDDAARAEAVTAVLADAQPRLHRCWEQAAASDWHVAGKVAVRLRVGAGGRVADVALDGTVPRLDDCIRAAFAGLAVRAPFTTGDAIELPLELRGEPNVTVRRKDAPALKVPGAPRARARILIDGQTAGASAASLTLVELPAGATWVRPGSFGTAVVHVLEGRVKLGAATAKQGDEVRFEDRSMYGLRAASRAELLVLMTPPGGEQAYRKGAFLGAIGVGPEPRIGKGEIRRLGGEGEHVHDGDAEILYVLSGRGEIAAFGSKYPIEPGMAVHVPAGARHALTGELRALQFFAPSKGTR